MIQLTAIGRLGKDSETKQVGDKLVSNFVLAVDTGFGDKKKTLWINCSIWNKEKLAKFLVKGTMVYVQGEPSVRAYVNKNNNEPTASLDMTVLDLKLLSGGEKKEEQVFVSGSSEPVTIKKTNVESKTIKSASELLKSFEDSDLPF